jgi:hypothetical protein
MMSSVSIIAIAAGFIGLFAAGVSIFAIGKYNHLVTLRHRISTEMLQLDLALRKQSAELQALGSELPGHQGDGVSADFFSHLAQAEEKSHQAVSGRLNADNLAGLSLASDLIASCWEVIVRAEQEDVVRTAGHRLETNAKAWERIHGLVADYRHFTKGFSCRWVALVSGFDPLSAGNSLASKTNEEMLPHQTDGALRDSAQL